MPRREIIMPEGRAEEDIVRLLVTGLASEWGNIPGGNREAILGVASAHAPRAAIEGFILRHWQRWNE